MNQPTFSEDENRDESGLSSDFDKPVALNRAESQPDLTTEENIGDGEAASPILIAELVDQQQSPEASLNRPFDVDWRKQPDRLIELGQTQAVGGAVGGFVLGVWSVISAFITPYAFINAGLAVFLGIYGLSSQRKRLAVMGIVLGCFSGMLILSGSQDLFWQFWFPSGNN